MARTVTLYLLDASSAPSAIGQASHIESPKRTWKLCNRGSDDCSKHLKQSGIYFLFGYDPKSGERGVYVGQAGARANGKGVVIPALT